MRQKGCCGVGCIFNNSSNGNALWLLTLMILHSFVSQGALTVYMENSLWFEFSWSEICTEVSFTSPETMWMLIRKLPHTKLKFYPEVKSQTSLSSLWYSSKCVLKKTTPVTRTLKPDVIIQSRPWTFRPI